jgi:hypothetical protein
MYFIGRSFGAAVLRNHPWWSGFLTEERERTIEKLIKEHGIKAFFVARFLVGLRSPFYLTAGILKVPYRWFLLADAICATVVIGGFFGLSYAFGDSIALMIRSAEKWLTVAAVAATVLAVAAFFWFRRRRLRLLDQDPESLFENREWIFGPAADGLPDRMLAGEGGPGQPEAAGRPRSGEQDRTAASSPEPLHPK